MKNNGMNAEPLPGKAQKILPGILLGITGGLVLVFAGLPWFLPLENEADRKRADERLQIKSSVLMNQTNIFSHLDMETAFSEEADRMVNAIPSPVREAAQKARPLPLVTD